MNNTPRPLDQVDGIMTCNQLLAALPAETVDALRPLLSPTHHPLHSVVVLPDAPIPVVYFPVTCVMSVVSSMEDGSVVEVGMVGHEGMVGIPVFLGVDRMPNTVVIQGQGDSLAMSAGDLRQAVRQHEPLCTVLGRYTQWFMNQVSQTAACNRLHPIEARAARWLLMVHDRVGADEFILTHEYLATMLGVRRASVTLALSGFQQDGLVAYRRGHLAMLNRLELESRSCECYQAISKGSNGRTQSGPPGA